MPKQSILCEKHIFTKSDADLCPFASQGRKWENILFYHSSHLCAHVTFNLLLTRQIFPCFLEATGEPWSVSIPFSIFVFTAKNHITLSRWHFSHKSKTPDIFIVHWHCITLEIFQSTFLEQNMSPKFFCFISFPFSHQSRRNNIIPLCPNFLLPTTIFPPSPVW